jgi:hypothetical protein
MRDFNIEAFELSRIFNYPTKIMENIFNFFIRNFDNFL